MDIVTKKISELHLAKRNVRRHPKKQLEELRRSFDMFKQYRPLVVDANGEVIVGNGFLEAMMGTDVQELDCIVLPENTPESYKKKLMIADNKIFVLGADAMSVVDEIISEMGDFDIPGFDEDILMQLYTETEQAAGKIPTNIKAVSGIIPEERKNDISSTSERRTATPPQDDESKYEKNEAVVTQQKENADRPYITCPHCGVKIYGYN